MSATGHQGLSIVTSGEMPRNTATVTSFSPELGEITEAKDIGCVAEFVMAAFSANGLRS
jgi:hypothetical protein